MSSDDDNFGFYNRREVSRITTLSKTTIWRYVDEEMFPAPFKVSARKSLWWRQDVLDWAECVRTGVKWRRPSR